MSGCLFHLGLASLETPVPCVGRNHAGLDGSLTSCVVAVAKRGSCIFWLNGDFRPPSQGPPKTGGCGWAQDRLGSPSFPEPGSSLLCDVQGGLRPAPGRTRTLRFQAGRRPRMLEPNHMLTGLQAFLPQYWSWTHWPNKVEIFCRKREDSCPLLFTCCNSLKCLVGPGYPRPWYQSLLVMVFKIHTFTGDGNIVIGKRTKVIPQPTTSTESPRCPWQNKSFLISSWIRGEGDFIFCIFFFLKIVVDYTT